MATGAAPRTGARTVLRAAPLLAGAALLLWWAIPRVAGAGWGTVLSALAAIPLSAVLVLATLWAAGLLAHSFVLTGALPGLTTRRALTLNMTGSAVSGVAPLGGALGMATNLAMTRRWLFRDRAFAVYTVVTNLWDVLAKLVLPIIALGALLAAGSLVPPALLHAAWTALVALVLVLALTVAVIASDRCATAVARAVARVGARLLPRHADAVERHVESTVATLRDTRSLITSTWGRLSLGMAAYVTLQGLLLAACLHLTAPGLTVAAVLAGFAVERLLSLALLTPAGTGFAEAATIATVIALGGDPVGVAAAVLVYRGFIVLLEIPVGGVWLGGWLLARTWKRSEAGAQ